EGRNSMPWFGIPLLPLVTPPNSDGTLIVNMNILPDSNGMFRVIVPEGERRVGNPSGLAPGYAVKGITYGPMDLLKTPMKVSIDDKSQLIVTVTAPSQSPVLVSGRVTGVDPAILSRGGVTLGINAQGYVGLRTFVSADGSFTFPEVFPGRYA